jgi:hypothetical protein
MDSFFLAELKISPLVLLKLNALKKCLEISCAKSAVVSTLNQLQKYRWSVLDRFAEDLKQ